MNPLEETALGYAERGWPVLPVSPADKTPLVPRDRDEAGNPIPRTGGLYKATTDSATIRAWWRAWPDALVGLRTGLLFVVVDLDVRTDRDGITEFSKLVARWGTLPSTLRVRTPQGGLHLYFSIPAREIRNSESRIARGIDVRAIGGYVIGAGSALPDGRAYRQLRGPAEPADMPGWLVDLACPAPPPRPPMTSLVVAAGPYARAVLREETAAIIAAPNGEQETTLNRAAFKVGRRVAQGRIDRSAAERALIDAGCQMPSFDPQRLWVPREVERKVRAALDAGIRGSRP